MALGAKWTNSARMTSASGHGCLSESIVATAALPQIAAALLQHHISAAVGQNWTHVSQQPLRKAPHGGVCSNLGRIFVCLI